MASSRRPPGAETGPRTPNAQASEPPPELAELAALYASIQYAPGAGGNLSLKSADGSRMWVKASGARLSRASGAEAWVEVDAQAMRAAYAASGAEAQTRLEALFAPDAQGRKPSMEAGFHALLGGRYVVHLHPLHLTALLCIEEGRTALEDMLAEFEPVWIPYITPGHPLARLIAQRAGGRREAVLLLQNHGLIVSTDRLDTARALPAEIERRAGERIAEALRKRAEGGRAGRMDRGPRPAEREKEGEERGEADKEARPRFLFPDAAVFLAARKGAEDPGAQAAPNPSAEEVLLVHRHLMECVPKLGRPRFLTPQEGDELLNLDAEKHRKRVAGRG